MKYLTKLLVALFLTVGLTACSDFLSPETPQNKPIETIESVQDLRGIMGGAYNRLSQSTLYGRDYVILGEVRTGNAWSVGYSGRFITESKFGTTPQGSGGIWTDAYEVIANTNLVINSDTSEITGQGLKQVKGAAYATRALAHMMLLKMYGQQFVDGSKLGIPYVTTFAKEENFFPERLTVSKTLNKIEADYKKALTLMDPSAGGSKTQMTYYAAQALLSRFYLFTGDYKAAKNAAEEVINGGNYSLINAKSYVNAWKKDGKPAIIFEIAFTSSDNLGSDSIFQMLAGNSYGDVEITKELYNLYSSKDVRKDLLAKEYTSNDKSTPFVDYRMVGKFVSRTKNTPVIRYAEVILTYAEALARQPIDNDSKALKWLNKIPSHRNASTYPKSLISQEQKLIDKILLERRKELAMEGLYYWQRLRTGKDIDRTGVRTPTVIPVHVAYGNYKLALPIPIQETDANPNLKQNKGYK